MSQKYVGTNGSDNIPQTQKQETLCLALDSPVPPTPNWPSPPVSSSSSFRRASTASTTYSAKSVLLDPGGINILD
ncbi:hypothetical protein HK100_008351, partial [Physocladia obscura]